MMVIISNHQPVSEDLTPPERDKLHVFYMGVFHLKSAHFRAIFI